jgi:hypothetical protein
MIMQPDEAADQAISFLAPAAAGGANIVRAAAIERPPNAGQAASRPAHLPAPTATGLEAVLKELFPILRPIPSKVLVGGVIAIVGVVSVLVIVGTGAGQP